jgi:Predicted membrane protein (DUF2339)
MPMADDRLEQLERRVAELENLVRQLVTRAVAASPGGALRERPVRPPLHASLPDAVQQSPAPSPPRVVVRPKVTVVDPLDRGIDWEQWIGQRGLLVVGILALLATGGFFLNYAIQHGWIPPAVRATGAILAGIALAVWGDRLVVRKGMLRYGAAIIGGGGGLVYLGIWAAAGPYELFSREVGVLLLALTSALVVALAVRHGVEALGVWALVGAYLAPLFLAGAVPEPAKLLAYMAVIGPSFLILASRVSWRVTFDVALAGFFLLPASLIPNGLNSSIGTNYAILGAIVALLATEPQRSTAWPEARLGALVLVWAVLFAVTQADSLRWVALSGGFLITAIVWWQQRRADPLAGIEKGELSIEALVYLTPLLLVALAAFRPPRELLAWGGAVPAVLALVYLGSGWLPAKRHLVAMGFALLAFAISGQWDGAVVAAGWAILAAVAGASGRWARRPGASEIAVILAPLVFLQLFTVAHSLRAANDPAFIGSWSLAWYVCVLGLAFAAYAWQPRPRGTAEDNVSVALWALAASTVLVGGSLELLRLQVRSTVVAETALVVYWVVFAIALVRAASRLHPATLALALRSALLLLAGAYLLQLVSSGQRPDADRAFVGVWAQGWYACCVGGVLGALWWPADEKLIANLRVGRPALWWMAGGFLLVGGSIELHRAFTSGLAGDLAISTFWLVYAATLVSVGFRLDRKAVPSAGLGVAALAALKIVLYDLAALQALYRVGSFFVLALITLAVAYAYNRRAKTTKASAV